MVESSADAMRRYREALYGPMLRAAFTAEGLPPEWGMAFARQESNFRPEVSNNKGGDAARGGSWGLCQMSLKTAREDLGFTGVAEELLQPALNARLAARLCALNAQRHKTRDLRDIAALYNSGRMYANTSEAVRQNYVARVVRFAAEYATPPSQ